MMFMDNFVYILGNKFEYDFLSTWIKYNRIKEGISQEALAHGVCSTSHLSYFENSKKKLRSEIIEALLTKLRITNITGAKDIGLIRQKFNILMFQVESFDYESAEITYNYLYCLYLSIFNFNENIFYKEVTEIILPFYRNAGYLDIHYKITLFLIKHLESKRKYKDANNLYQGLLS
jgi:transcriptional regulator with XRE-family HTH domain